MPTYHGIGVHWGASSSTLNTITGQMQTRDFSLKSEKELIKDGNGNTAGVVYYDQRSEAQFEYIPTSATINGTLNPSLPSIGTMLTVTDSVFTAIANTNWIVEDVDTKAANNSAMKVTLKLTSYTGVTS